MALEYWFRGQSSNVAPTKPDGDPHDFGAGLYLTDDLSVARLYAETRVLKLKGVPQIFSLNIERSQLGRVLVLDADPRWAELLNTPVRPGYPTREAIIGLNNENYGPVFQEFLKVHSIDLRTYDAVIGPEMVRGGRQLCILDKGGQPTPLRLVVQRQLVQLPRAVVGLELNIVTVEGPVPASVLMQPNSRFRRAAGNQAAVATVGMMVYGALQALGDAAIRKQAQADLDGKHAQAIALHLGRGEGVLAIISISESNRFTPMGDRLRSYLATYIQGGRTQAEALQLWSRPQMMLGAGEHSHIVEEYVWIGPGRR